MDKIIAVLLDEKQRKNFDDMMEDGTILKRLENLTFLIYVTFKRFLILSPRDFVLCGCLVKFNDGTVILPSYSVDLDETPENKKYIRAQLHIGGWILKKIDENNTLAYYYNRADMKGNLNSTILNFLFRFYPRLRYKAGSFSPSFAHTETERLYDQNWKVKIKSHFYFNDDFWTIAFYIL